MSKSPVWWLIQLIIAALDLTRLTPLERTLGAQARIVCLHMAWMRVAMLAFLGAVIAGALGPITRRTPVHQSSLAAWQMTRAWLVWEASRREKTG
jgi:hypothetical protein